MKGVSPTQRTLAAIKKQGFLAGIVEKFNRFGGAFGIRQDLFGFIDLVYLDTKRKCIVGVQCTGQHGHAAHKKKILGECRKAAKTWLRCGCLIELWSWRKLLVKRGGKQVKWTARIEAITKESFQPKE